MAKLVGRTKTCIWWIIGALCVAVFGRTSRTEEQPLRGQVEPIYGSPVYVETDAGKDIPEEDAEEKKSEETDENEQALALVDEYIDLHMNDEDQDRRDEIVVELKKNDQKTLSTILTAKTITASNQYREVVNQLAIARKSGDQKAIDDASAEKEKVGNRLRATSQLRLKVIKPARLPNIYARYGARIRR